MQPPDVDKTEQQQIAAQGYRDFLESPDESGIRWVRRKKDGSCFFLKDNKCQIYNVRPAICRLEPFTIVDYDYESGTVELALNFPFSECCMGVSEKETVPLDEIFKAAQVLVQRILALTALDMELPTTDKRVHEETRSRLLRRGVEAADLQV
jgi:Fe-S-cluster containining protein